jgi:hypothetical protein
MRRLTDRSKAFTKRPEPKPHGIPNLFLFCCQDRLKNDEKLNGYELIYLDSCKMLWLSAPEKVPFDQLIISVEPASNEV